ncbi:helix-turn-helix transcriptional regulator [Caenimonas aquaedulcis]|uniref:Response regulator transcription factor n=1 Tax=Caenimonas aquaedulcis TaxID=2793270 RepID=A0A931H4P8_9BURK|nr:LuxR C-terminal-related transcriptional regulator [Caenimonas aquaedulcis]MBG9388544.1 response regulator transcription factor [Caenimonas aquaedulcis]
MTSNDFDVWLDVLKSWPGPASDLVGWLTGPIRSFFPFERVLLIHGKLIAGEIHITHTLAHGHDEAFLRQLAVKFDLNERGALAHWLAHREPIAIEPAEPPAFASVHELQEIKQFRLGRVAAHGVLSLDSKTGTYFSFCGVPEALSQWHMDALKLLAPVLNERFLNYLAETTESNRVPTNDLTPRQAEIVRCVLRGMCNKTVARELGISEKTVRNQLTEVFFRLDVQNRTQLIARLR